MEPQSLKVPGAKGGPRGPGCTERVVSAGRQNPALPRTFSEEVTGQSAPQRRRK